MTTVRLPTTKIPPPVGRPVSLEGTVPGLVAVLVARDREERIAAQVECLLHRCDSVLLVDRASRDETVLRAEEAGARVLRLAAPAGEGEALRAGLHLSRELGYIGLVWVGEEEPLPEDIDRLALAHLQAPEALILGVGPGQAIAGSEWDEARALAEGREPDPVPDYQPPRSAGLPGMVEYWFEQLVQTSYAHPWGGPRVLPLQSILRRQLREPGVGVHLELLALSASAGIPTIEIELSQEPARQSLDCRRAAARLLKRLIPMVVRASALERMGMGGGYAPPTTSPLQLLLAASLAIGLVLFLSGCPKPIPPAMLGSMDCGGEHPMASWPGDGDAGQALSQLVADRSGFVRVWVDQGVELSDPALDGSRRFRGLLVRDGADRLRLRFLGPLGIPLLDYVQSDGAWQLTVPPVGILERGLVGQPLRLDGLSSLAGIAPDAVAHFFGVLEDVSGAQWQAGSCAVLELLDEGGTAVRRIGFRFTDPGWEVASEELVDGGEVQLLSRFEDYRTVGDLGRWPYQQEVLDPDRGSSLLFETRNLKTEGIDPSFFLFSNHSD
ncbi:MAG: hypothetical protein VX498_05280 [Myxococcota bacterium]|nr:hypothetical protein [Myxococcota bacterium]